MRKDTKIIIGVVAGVALLCACICISGFVALSASGFLVLDAMVMDDPAEVRQLATSLIDYDLPPGYREIGAMDMGFIKMILLDPDDSITPTDARPTISFIALTNVEMSEEEIQQQLQFSSTQSRQRVEMQRVSEQRVTLRDQDVVLSTYEGTDENGKVMREVVSSLFVGKKGLMMFTITGPEAAWNQAEVDAFIASLR